MNTINFKIESVIVPTGTRKLRAIWTPELAEDLRIKDKILTVKEWIKRRKMETLIREQFAYSNFTGRQIEKDIKEELDAFIKIEYGYREYSKLKNG